VTFLFAGFLVAFVLLVGGKEVSRWYVAAAKNAILEQRFDDAVIAADTGLRWNPEYAELLKIRAVANWEKKEFELCLSDYDRLSEIAAKDEEVNEADMDPLAAKANVLQRMNRIGEAIACWDRIVEFRREQRRLRDDYESEQAYAMSLNNRAYMEAQAYVLGDKDLDIKKSLSDIQTAIELQKGETDPVVIDTLGYLLLLNGEHEQALQQLDLAVKLTSEENRIRRKEYQQMKQRVVDQRPYDEALEQLDEQYSVILHHRGEAFAAVGEQDKAKADIDEAKRLGFNQEEGVW
jgi:tetratricopeptide (TPR) repeat protein